MPPNTVKYPYDDLLRTKIAGIEMRTPVLAASGTFGFGEEFADFVDLGRLGGIMVKGTTLAPRRGNDGIRIAETPQGMLNCIGLENPGVEHFLTEILPRIRPYGMNIIVNVSGSSVDDYAKIARRLNVDGVAALEINISCPNVKEGGMAFGVTCAGASSVVRAVRSVYDKTLIVKLSPNVTDITEIARAVEAEGADAISMINTLLGMAIDTEKRRPILSTITGGLSGPAVKPVALRMVWQTAQVVNIPIIGMGGIATATDAIEFLLAGATAIEVGTYNFVDPTATIQIVEGIENYMLRHGFSNITELIGALNTK